MAQNWNGWSDDEIKTAFEVDLATMGPGFTMLPEPLKNIALRIYASAYRRAYRRGMYNGQGTKARALQELLAPAADPEPTPEPRS